MWILAAGIAGTGDGACYNYIIIHCCFAFSIDQLSSDHLTKFCKKFKNFRHKHHFFDGSCRLKNARCQMLYDGCRGFNPFAERPLGYVRFSGRAGRPLS